VWLDLFTYGPEPATETRGPLRFHRARPRLVQEFHGLEVDGLDIFPWLNPRHMRGAEGREYDAVVGTSPGIGTQGQLLALRRGIPFVGIYTTDLPHYAHALFAEGDAHPVLRNSGLGEAARVFARRYLAWLYNGRRTSLVLTPTHRIRDDFQSFVDVDVEVLGRGSDTLTFGDVRREPRTPVRALYVGRVDYGQKNLEALEPLLDRIPELELWIVGGGDDLELLRRRFARHVASGRATITGRIDDADELRAVYESADIFVFPSLSDTLGQVVLEAQGAGLPVVVRDRGGPQELIVPGKTGIVTSSNTSFVWEVGMLAQRHDVRLRMSAAARAHALAAPTWDDIVDQFVEIMRRVAGRRATGGSR
jgi:glycosyltransferase involved in cell wall biosynthesis